MQLYNFRFLAVPYTFRTTEMSGERVGMALLVCHVYECGTDFAVNLGFALQVRAVVHTGHSSAALGGQQRRIQGWGRLSACALPGNVCGRQCYRSRATMSESRCERAGRP